MSKLTKNCSASLGFSTLELLIAFAIMTLSMTAVIMVAFGNQAVAVDTELAQGGLRLAEQNLELSGIQTIADFNSVASDLTPVPVAGTMFDKQITVSGISPCAKEIASKVIWNRNGGRTPSTTLSTVFVSTDQALAVGSNCSPTPPASDWDTPDALGTINGSDFHGQGTGIALAAISNNPYAIVTTDSTSQFNFYVIDILDPENFSASDIIGRLNIAGVGANGVATANINGNSYAFVISDSVTNQLQVVDISNANTPNPIPLAARTLPNMSIGVNPIPRTIYYYDEKIYIGTEYLAFSSPGQNEEFHIFDVSNPSNPTWDGSINVDRNVNDIMVVDELAYLANGHGGDNTPFKIYNIDQTSSDYLDEVGELNVSLSREGTAVYVLGNIAYLGLEKTSSGDDFYIIDVTNPNSPSSPANQRYSLDGNTSDVGDIIVQGRFAFIGKLGAGQPDTLQIWSIIDPTNAFRVNTCPNLLPPLPQDLTGMFFNDDYLFASYRSSEEFRILKDDPNLSCP